MRLVYYNPDFIIMDMEDCNSEFVFYLCRLVESILDCRYKDNLVGIISAEERWIFNDRQIYSWK